jgi:nicotinamide-nucleotide amidase
MENLPVPADAELASLARQLSARLLDRNWKMATAESCTGGWIAKCCTDLAGSSAWFERGFVTYSNRAKEEMLGVAAAVLTREGAVSRQVACEMAAGARAGAGVDAAVAVTGIAGPGGGSVEKPVGTVWLAWAIDGQDTSASIMTFAGDREAVRRRTVACALNGLLERLDP